MAREQGLSQQLAAVRKSLTERDSDCKRAEAKIAAVEADAKIAKEMQRDLTDRLDKSAAGAAAAAGSTAAAAAASGEQLAAKDEEVAKAKSALEAERQRASQLAKAAEAAQADLRVRMPHCNLARSC